MNGLSTVQFLSYLRSLNIKLSADGNRLRYNSPAGMVTPDLQSELVARKPEILRFLREACQAMRPQPPAIARVPRDGELPLSFGQMRLWLLDQLEPNSVAYNIPSRFRLKGNFDLAVFEQCLSEIVRRHEVLRTCYLNGNGNPVQKIAAPQPFKIPVVDLQTLSETERQREAERLAFVDAMQPFDLSRAPLMRATLLKLAPEEQLLLMTMHHIAFDAWSFGVLLPELSVLYKAFRNEQISPLPELPIQYVDFAVWQRGWLKGEVLQKQLDYFKDKLSGTPPVLELPTDRPRPAVQTYNGEQVFLTLSKKLTDALRNLSQQEGVTLFITLLAAFKVLLVRYTGQEDILVGTPIANRNRVEIEGLIGFFVNTLVLRSDLSGNPTFRALLGRVQETALGAYAHQDFPFEELVEELNPKRDRSRSPLFQVLFSFFNSPMRPLELPELEPSHMKLASGTSKFDLILYAYEQPEGLSFTLEYNTDLFDDATIVRMAGHFQTLLEGVTARPESRLWELPLLTPLEKRQMLVKWNDTPKDYPRNVPLQQLFETQAERTPDAIALVAPSLTMAPSSQVSCTYAELNARANRLACYLQTLGVGPQVLVAVCMERTAEMVIGLLAILKAGGAYVPLDPAYPAERTALILEETKVQVILTQQSVAASLPSHEVRVMCMDDANLQAKVEELVSNNFEFSINQDSSHLAYVLYTSGSTGKPKGVEICHRAVVNFLNSMRITPGIEAGDTLLSVTTLSFDIFGLELWLPLVTGAKTVIVSQQVAMDGRAIAEAMLRCGATVMQATPSTWRLLLQSGWEGNPGLKILCGGEAWPPELAEQLLPRCKTLWNMYGPTETTIWSAVQEVRGDGVLIGHPIANTQFYVVDSHLQAVPVGVPGELLIGGDGLARGYLNRPELTAEKFIANRFSTDGNSRLYRTGDLVRYRPDGELEFLGRIDHQVKIRGFRIELGEIETALKRHAGIQQAVVVVREDTPNDKRLVAYIVASSDPAPGSSELRSVLKQQLPEYMVPNDYVVLTELPLTPNGKIDRKALPAPEGTRSEYCGYVAPRDAFEQYLCEAWAAVLGVDKVGIRDNFFDLGGHSLLALKITSALRNELGIDLRITALFDYPSIEDLALAVEENAIASISEQDNDLR